MLFFCFLSNKAIPGGLHQLELGGTHVGCEIDTELCLVASAWPAASHPTPIFSLQLCLEVCPGLTCHCNLYVCSHLCFIVSNGIRHRAPVLQTFPQPCIQNSPGLLSAHRPMNSNLPRIRISVVYMQVSGVLGLFVWFPDLTCDYGHFNRF